MAAPKRGELMEGQWYRCSRCGRDEQWKDGQIVMCCWADRYAIPAEDAVPAVSD